VDATILLVTPPNQLAVAIFPHLIPAATIPNGELERALTEPLAEQRDEVVYVICSHRRVVLGPAQPGGGYAAWIASGHLAGAILWSDSHWWARVRFPEHARPSQVAWAVIDDSLELIEDLPPIELDVENDPDGAAGRNRQELLAWVYDRHLELWKEPKQDRGSVDGGRIEFRIEYVGSSGSEALRRPAGAHHRVPSILGRMLLYEPHRLVYPLACEARFAFYDDADPERTHPAVRLRDAVEAFGLDRRLLIAIAEDALIAASGAPYNIRNTGRRRFPASAAGGQLASLGVERVRLGMYGLPPRVRLVGPSSSWDFESRAVAWELRTAASRR
jgi:hypothetical protein